MSTSIQLLITVLLVHVSSQSLESIHQCLYIYGLRPKTIPCVFAVLHQPRTPKQHIAVNNDSPKAKKRTNQHKQIKRNNTKKQQKHKTKKNKTKKTKTKKPKKPIFGKSSGSIVIQNSRPRLSENCFFWFFWFCFFCFFGFGFF